MTLHPSEGPEGLLETSVGDFLSREPEDLKSPVSTGKFLSVLSYLLVVPSLMLVLSNNFFVRGKERENGG